MGDTKTLAELTEEFRQKQAAQYARLDAEQEAYAANLRAKLEERLGALLLSSPRIKYTAEGREVIRVQALAAIREVEPAGDLIDVSTPEERAQGKLRFRKVAPLERVVLEGAVAAVVHHPATTQACTDAKPCGVYGCPVCSVVVPPGGWYFGAPNPPANPATTPTYGSPAVPAKGKTQIIPPEQRGSKKPGGGGSRGTRAANTERGYRVLAYGEWMNAVPGTREGRVFSTPDLATQCARHAAKDAKETFVVLRDGARWKLLKKDGDEVVIG